MIITGHDKKNKLVTIKRKKKKNKNDYTIMTIGYKADVVNVVDT